MSHEKSVHINVTGRERIQEYHTNRALIYMKVVKKKWKACLTQKSFNLDINGTRWCSIKSGPWPYWFTDDFNWVINFWMINFNTVDSLFFAST